MNVFLDGIERCNSKTYYYTRLVSEHLIGLIVQDEEYKNELKKQYRKLNRGWEIIPIYNIQNNRDVWTIKDRINRNTLKGIIYDNDLVIQHILDFNKVNLYWFLNKYELSDDKIREVILTDMALGEYMYE